MELAKLEKYWAYSNGEILGPVPAHFENKLKMAKTQGFTTTTLPYKKPKANEEYIAEYQRLKFKCSHLKAKLLH